MILQSRANNPNYRKFKTQNVKMIEENIQLHMVNDNYRSYLRMLHIKMHVLEK